MVHVDGISWILVAALLAVWWSPVLVKDGAGQQDLDPRIRSVVCMDSHAGGAVELPLGVHGHLPHLPHGEVVMGDNLGWLVHRLLI